MSTVVHIFDLGKQSRTETFLLTRDKSIWFHKQPLTMLLLNEKEITFYFDEVPRVDEKSDTEYVHLR